MVLGDKVYIGGGNTFPKSSSTLFVYNITRDSWDTLDTPTEGYALVTYLSQLVLVGGTDPATGWPTNQLWVLNNNDNWTQPHSPMPTSRWGASAVSVDKHLIVAGGFGDLNSLDVVEVYDGHQWRRAQYLPRACYWMKSALHKGNWYLAGGVDQDREVFYTSLKSLIATTQSVGAEHASVWNALPHLPFPFSSPVMFDDQLITIGGGYRCSSAIHAYSHPTKSWVYAGDLPIVCKSTCTLILPSGELLVVGGETYFGLSSLAFRAKLRGDLLHNYTVGWVPFHLQCTTPFTLDIFLFSSTVTTFPDVNGHYDVSTHDWEELAQDTEDFFSSPSLTGDSSVALVYTEI